MSACSFCFFENVAYAKRSEISANCFTFSNTLERYIFPLSYTQFIILNDYTQKISSYKASLSNSVNAKPSALLFVSLPLFALKFSLYESQTKKQNSRDPQISHVHVP